MRKYRLITLIILVCWLALPVVAQEPDPAIEEIDACLGALLDSSTPDAVMSHDYKLVTPGQQSPTVDVSLWGTRLVSFDCPRFSIFEDENGELTIQYSGRAKGRKFEPLELKSFRWYLSLDPFWVLHHVKERLPLFEYQEDAENGLAIYTYYRNVLLSDPVEKRYGAFIEELVLDKVNHTVMEYSVRALMPEGAPVVDMLNVYEYQKAVGPQWVRISQGTYDGTGATSTYKVHY